jgi:hypothetical protein
VRPNILPRHGSHCRYVDHAAATAATSIKAAVNNHGLRCSRTFRPYRFVGAQVSQTHFSDGTSAFIGTLLCRCHLGGSQDRHSSAVSAYATRRSSRLILRQRAAISADMGQCGCGASEHLAMSEATALKRTGAIALACGGQVTKMTAGVPAGLSSSMMISEPFTRALARVVDLDKAGSFRCRPCRGAHISWRGRLIVCGNPRVGLPEPVPPLIRNASLASIMRDKRSAVPGVSEPEATQASSEKLNEAQGNRVRPGFRAGEWL